MVNSDPARSPKLGNPHTTYYSDSATTSTTYLMGQQIHSLIYYDSLFIF